MTKVYAYDSSLLIGVKDKMKKLIPMLMLSMVFSLGMFSANAQCTEIIPPGNPTAALTSGDVTFNIQTTDANNNTVDADLISVTINGEPNPFTELYAPSSMVLNFGNPQATSQFVRENGATVDNITNATFEASVLAANIDRNLRHYLSLDGTIQSTDYADYLYDTPIVSAGNRYVLVTERYMNNTMSIQALDASGNPIGGGSAAVVNSGTYINSGIKTDFGQVIGVTIYPLTALVSSGTAIHGIRVTQTGAPAAPAAGDGGDGKVFILYDPFTRPIPPVINSVSVTQPSGTSCEGAITVSATAQTGFDIEYSIDNGANWQSSNTFSNLAPNSYTVVTRLAQNTGCATDYATNPVVLTNAGCVAPTDTDGDNNPDITDLDDDNDGILDFDEECMGYIAQNKTGAWKGNTLSNATITWTPAVADAPGLWVVNSAQNKFHMDDGVGGAEQWVRRSLNVAMTVTFDTPVPASEIGFIVIDLDAVSAGGNPSFSIEVNGAPDVGGIFIKEDIISNSYKDDNVTVANGVITPSNAVDNEYALIIGKDETLVSSLTITSSGISSGDTVGYSLFAYKSCDTDGDGLADKLDLDSDNDGCPDVIEGDGSLTYTDLASGGLSLCTDATCVDANGVPTPAGAGQAIGTSKDPSQQANECDPCDSNNPNFTDTDGDGVADRCDLDKDNDGILDTDETQCVATGTNLSNYEGVASDSGYSLDGQAVATNIPGVSINHSYTGDAPSYYHVYSGQTPDYKHTAFQGVAGDGNDLTTSATTTFVYSFNKPIINLEVDLRDLDNGTAIGKYERVKIEAFYNGTPVTDKLVDLAGSHAIMSANGYYENLVSSTINITEVSVEGRVAEKYFSPVNEVRVTLSSNWGAGTVLYFSGGCLATDTDGDGTPDYLDTDSDGDGCPDALEANANLTYNDLQNGSIQGGVDGSGIPSGNQAAGVGTAQDASQQADICDPCNANNPNFTDTDGDGVADPCDLDDDNDGILDTVECGAEFPVWTQDGTGVKATVDGNDVTVTRTGTVGSIFPVTMTSTTVGYNGFQGLNETAAGALGKTTMASSIAQLQTTYTYTFANPTAKDIYLHVFAFGNGSSVEVSPNLSIETWNNSTVQGSSVITESGSGANDAGFSALVPAGTTTFNYTLNAAGAYGDGSFAFLTSNCKDTDSDGIVDKLDLDSDNDGCPDAIEGGSNDAQDPITEADLVTAAGSVTDGNGGAVTENLCAGTGCVYTNGVPNKVDENNGQTVGVSRERSILTITQQPQAQIACEDDAATLTTTATFDGAGNWTYQLQKQSGTNWNDVSGQTGAVVSGTEITLTTSNIGLADAGNYRIKFIGENNTCEHLSQEFTITVNERPTQPKYTTVPENACGVKGSITVEAQAGCEYSIDGTNYSANTVFDNLDAGLYTIHIRNAGGCVARATAVVQLDSDCDGVGNNDDLDDDNDGILDTDENACGSNLVQNPSFEAQNFIDGSVGTVWSNYGTYFGQDLNTDQLTGWNYTTNLDGWSGVRPDMAAAADGDQYVDVLGKDTRSTNPPGGTNTLSQVVATEAGKTYTFSFYWGEDMGHTVAPYLGETNLTASVIDNTNNTVIKEQNLVEMAEGNGSGVRGPKHWNFYTTTFVATSASTKITFTAVATGPQKGNGAALDMVTLQEVCDTDGDGTPDSLDTDSDGDGCPDALEANATLTYADLQNGSIQGSVDGSGIPSGNQAAGVGTAQSATQQADICDPCHPSNPSFTDTDGDGVADPCDLDDDNDGIPDDVEKGNIVFDFDDSTEGWYTINNNVNGGAGNDNQIVHSTATSTVYNSCTVSATGSSNMNIAGESPTNTNYLVAVDAYGGYMYARSPSLGGQDYSNIIGGTLSYDAYTYRVGYTGNPGWATGNPGRNKVVYIYDTSGRYITYSSPLSNAEKQNWENGIWNTISIPVDAASWTVSTGANFADVLSNVDYISIKIEFINGGNTADCSSIEYYALDNIVFEGLPNDTDGDGIPNHLDTDSDGDGCPDAIEGGAGLTYNDLATGGMSLCATSTCVDPNGVPTVVNGGQTTGTSQDASQQAAECDSCNASSTLFVDTDGDTVGDDCDLDDDNDGILDTEECDAPWMTWTVNDPTPGYPSASGDAVVTGTVNGMIVNVTNNSNLRDPQAQTAAAVHVNFPGTAGLNSNGANLLGKSILSMANSAVGTTYTFTFTAPTTTDLYLHFTAFDLSVNFSSNVIIETLVNGTGIGTSSFVIDPPGAPNRGGLSALLPAGTTSFSFTYPNSGGDNYFIGISAPCTDIDGDGIPNYLDLDSDGDGCPDAIEGDENITASDLVASSMAGGSTGVTDNLGNTAVGTNTDDRGVPTIVNTGGAADVDGDVGQGVGGSQASATITITEVPQDQVACVNGTAVFTSMATVSGANSISNDLSYNWQMSTDGTTWTDITSVTGASVSGAVSGTATSGSQVTLTLENVQTTAANTFFKVFYSHDANSCGAETASATFTISDLSGIATSVTPATCGNPEAVVNLTGLPAENYTITYTLNATNQTVTGNTPGNSITIPQAGTYEFEIENAAGCIATTTATVAAVDCVTLVKTDALNDGGDGLTAGDVIDYTFTINNTGNTPLTGITLDDPMFAAANPPVVVPAIPNIPVGGTHTFTVAYTLSQTDMNNGAVTNTATVSANGGAATDTSGTTGAGDDPTVTALTQTPSLELTKSSELPANATVGSQVTYTFTVVNTGNVTIDNLSITDAKVGNVTLGATSLAPSASTTGTALYTLELADFNAGSVTNTATVAGTDPQGGAVTDVSDSGNPADTGAGDDNDNDGDTTNDPTVTPLTQTPSLELTKSSELPANAVVGSQVTYTFTVVNTGNVTIDNLSITDAKVGNVTLGTTSLDPSASTTGTALYTLELADFNAGSVTNTATVAGTDPQGGAVSDVSDSGNPADTGAGDDNDGDGDTTNDPTVTPLTQTPSLELTKSSELPANVAAGSQVTYTFTIVNTGNVTIDNLSITDTKVGNVTLGATSLAPSASTTGTALYTLTQTDFNAGKVTNTATVSGTDPQGGAVSDVSDSGNPGDTGAGDDNDGDGDTTNDPTVTPLTQTPSLELTKSSELPANATVGSQVTYTFTVVNTGNVTIDNLSITDTKVGNVTLGVTSLDPSASTTGTALYTLQLADFNAGSVTNTATVAGTDPQGGAVSDVSDSGNPADTGAGDDNDGDGDTTNDPTVTPLTQTPSLELTKSSELPANATVGSQVTYTFTIVNTGNVTIDNLSITDTKVGNVTLGATSLDPSASTTGTALYTLQPADFNAGKVTNTATVAGTDPQGGAVSDVSDSGNPADTGAGDDNDGDGDTTNDPTVTSLVQTPSLELTKSSELPANATVGSQVTYTFTVVNTGNVTIDNLSITDTKVGNVTLGVTSLDPSASTTGTALYTLTQTDFNAGKVTNTATVEGTDPQGGAVSDVSDSGNPGDNNNDGDGDDTNDPTVTALTQTPSLELIKSSELPANVAAGSQVTYTFTIVNTGNVTIDNLSITDAKVGNVTLGATSLDPSASTTGTALYTLQPADFNAGSVTNTATVAGTDPQGGAVSDVSDSGNPGDTGAGDDNDGDGDTTNDPTVTSLVQTPSLELTKSSELPANATVGSQVTYTFTVVNTGNVAINNLVITDAKVGNVTLGATSLDPSASTTGTALYTLELADFNAGSVTNTATVEGTDPQGGSVTDVSDSGNPGDTGAGDDNDGDGDTTNDPTVTPLTQTPSLELTKSSELPANATVGSQVTYTFTVVNTGNVTIDNLSITDAKVGNVTLGATSLAPSASTTGTALYTLTQTDFNAGSVTNTATVSGTDPQGGAVSDVSDSGNPGDTGAGDDNDNDGDTTNDPTVTPLSQRVGIELIKTSTLPTVITVGTTINYTFTVVNTGNVTLNNIVVTDPKLTGIAIVPPSTTSLSSGAVATFTGSYVLDQADITAGQVTNTAEVAATTVTGTSVTDTSDSGNPGDEDNDGDGDLTNDPTITNLPPNVLVARDDVYTTVPTDLTNPTVVGSVLGNDTLNGVAVTTSNTEVTPITTGDVLIDRNGRVTIPAGTPSGVYTTIYTICVQSPITGDVLVNCTTAEVTVTVSNAIVAEDDTATVTPTDLTSDIPAGSVLGNDTLNGVPVTTANTEVTPVTTGNVLIDEDGNITVPGGTPSGVYSTVYTICEQDADTGNVTDNCTTATATVVVNNTILAEDDSYTVTPTDVTTDLLVGNILGNDTLNGVTVTTTNVEVTPITTGDVLIDKDGNVTVPAGTPGGVYTVVYTICEQNANTEEITDNCTTATVTVTVNNMIVANDDVYVSAAGGTTSSILENDILGGVTGLTASDVSISATNVPEDSLTLNPDGTITVKDETPSGVYSFTYEICNLATDTASCATAVATVTVANHIEAEDDSYTVSPTDSTSDISAGNVLGNDTLNGVTVTTTNTEVTPVTTGNVLIDKDGNVTVPGGVPSGTYSTVYTICEQDSRTGEVTDNCTTAVVTVVVVACKDIPTADCDGDGVTNEQELLDGTDPNDPCSYDSANATKEQSDEWKSIDCDGDGVTNGQELLDGTSPTDTCSYNVENVTGEQSDEWKAADCDGDGVTNEQELVDGTNPNDPCSYNAENITKEYSDEWKAVDCDGDGVTNGQELLDGTNPNDPCSYDFENITKEQSDEWKSEDCDGDGVTNGQELLDGTSPTDTCSYNSENVTKEQSDEWKAADCDGDGVTNGQEVVDGTNPADPCSYNSENVTKEYSDEWKAADCDGDGVTNGQELLDGTNPTDPCSYLLENVTGEKGEVWKSADCDGDGVTNGQELVDGTNPNDPCSYTQESITKEQREEWRQSDCDGDGVTNGQELVDGTNFNDPCDYYILSQNKDNVSEEWKQLDCDNDGLTNEEEQEKGTNPNDPCSPKECKDCAELLKLLETGKFNQLVTPNSDSYNEFLDLSILKEYSEKCVSGEIRNNVKIFNRWGALVYETDNYMLKDGRNRFEGFSSNSLDYKGGEKLPAGVYFFIITSGSNLEKTGYFYILNE